MNKYREEAKEKMYGFLDEFVRNYAKWNDFNYSFMDFCRDHTEQDIKKLVIEALIDFACEFTQSKLEQAEKENENNETNPTDDFDLISKPPFKSKKITIRIMTAEEKARKYLENKYSELDHTANYDPAGGSELYINEIDVAKIMTDYLNSQRETIFKEELEEKLPSEEEIHEKKAALIDEGYNWDETAEELVKWLIQYLKK